MGRLAVQAAEMGNVCQAETGFVSVLWFSELTGKELGHPVDICSSPPRSSLPGSSSCTVDGFRHLWLPSPLSLQGMSHRKPRQFHHKAICRTG